MMTARLYTSGVSRFPARRDSDELRRVLVPPGENEAEVPLPQDSAPPKEDEEAPEEEPPEEEPPLPPRPCGGTRMSSARGAPGWHRGCPRGHQAQGGDRSPGAKARGAAQRMPAPLSRG